MYNLVSALSTSAMLLLLLLAQHLGGPLTTCYVLEACIGFWMTVTFA